MTTANLRTALAAGALRSGISARLDRLSDGRFAAVLAAPGLLLMGLFVVPPILGVLGLSLFRAELGRDSYRPFIALRNYAVHIGNDAEFMAALPLTVGVAVLVTVIAVPAALGAAVLIHGRARRVASILSVILLLPWAVAPIADGIFWRLMFAGDGHLSQALDAFGLPPVVLREAPGTIVVTVLAVIWRAIPLLGVLFLGALRQVPREIQRAARIDGASAWETFRHVTLPAIAPSVIAACLIQIVLTLQVFEVQFAISGDTPPPGSILAGLAIYRVVIGQISLGYGAAMTVVLGLVIAACLLVLYRLVIRPARFGVPGREETELPQLRLDAGVSAGGPMPWAGRAEPEPHESPVRIAVRRIIGRGASTVGGAVLAIWVVAPLAWILVVSTQNRLIQEVPPRLVAPSIAAYQRLVALPEWHASALVSITVTVLATGLALVIATLTAYPLARFRLRGGRALLLFLLGTQLIPPIAIALPVLYVFAGLGLRNSIAGLVLVNICFWTPLLVWLVRSAFLGVPANLERSARIDGSSRLGAIFRIALPAAAPGIAAAAAIVFIGIWNDFVFVATLGGRDTSTLPRFLSQSFSPSYPALAAAIVVTIAPCIALILLLRRRIFQLV